MADGGVGKFSYTALHQIFVLAGENWYQIDGACARQGVDPARVGFRRFPALVYSMMVENLGGKERREFDEALFEQRPADPDDVDQSVVDDEMKLFAAARAQAQ